MKEVNPHEIVLAAVCGLLFWLGHNQAGSGLLAVLAGLRMFQYKKLESNQEVEGSEKPRMCAFRATRGVSTSRRSSRKRIGCSGHLLTTAVQIHCSSLVTGQSHQFSMTFE